ncbi:uncharacterized protein TNCV_4792441 [Trichonephila clavipes]|nr:uncharacterized protein TNCV_4792441 [Trichonephila clavipes]
MDVCKCIVPFRHGGALNSRRATSPLVWLVEREERWEAPDHTQGFLPLNWGGTKQKRTVTSMVLKAKANDRRKILALSRDEFRGHRPDSVRQGRNLQEQRRQKWAPGASQDEERVSGFGFQKFS